MCRTLEQQVGECQNGRMLERALSAIQRMMSRALVQKMLETLSNNMTAVKESNRTAVGLEDAQYDSMTDDRRLQYESYDKTFRSFEPQLLEHYSTQNIRRSVHKEYETAVESISTKVMKNSFKAYDSKYEERRVWKTLEDTFPDRRHSRRSRKGRLLKKEV